MFRKEGEDHRPWRALGPAREPVAYGINKRTGELSEIRETRAYRLSALLVNRLRRESRDGRLYTEVQDRVDSKLWYVSVGKVEKVEYGLIERMVRKSAGKGDENLWGEITVMSWAQDEETPRYSIGISSRGSIALWFDEDKFDARVLSIEDINRVRAEKGRMRSIEFEDLRNMSRGLGEFVEKVLVKANPGPVFE